MIRDRQPNDASTRERPQEQIEHKVPGLPYSAVTYFLRTGCADYAPIVDQAFRERMQRSTRSNVTLY
jgi:hypothetical protein